MSNELGDLEAYLQTALKPVTPRTDFVHGLRSRLIVEPSSADGPVSFFQSMIFVTIVGIGGIVLLISTVRSMVHLLHNYTHSRQHWSGKN